MIADSTHLGDLEEDVCRTQRLPEERERTPLHREKCHCGWHQGGVVELVGWTR